MIVGNPNPLVPDHRRVPELICARCDYPKPWLCTCPEGSAKYRRPGDHVAQEWAAEKAHTAKVNYGRGPGRQHR